MTREVDLIEEVARLYGIDKFPARLPSAKLPSARLQYAEAEDRLRERLIGLGYREIITIPIVDESDDAVFRPQSATPARIATPLAEDASVMRSTGAVTMVSTLGWNLNHGQRNLRLFEFGEKYGWNGTEPVETRVLTLGATGLAREKGVAETERAFTFADLKGDLDQIGHLAGGLIWNAGAPQWLHPAHAGTILHKEQTTLRSASWYAGQLSRRVSNDSSCARTLTSRSWNSIRFAEPIKQRVRRCGTNRSRAFPLSNAISLVVADVELRSPAWWRRFDLSALQKFHRSTRWTCFAAKTCPPGRFRCWCA